jgi:putative transposase
MARRRETEAGGTYHVWTRGSNRDRLYRDELDHERWEELLGRVAARFGWLVLSYCEMPNHFHLVLRTPEDTLSCGMQRLNALYSRKTNARHGREAHLFRQRFRSKTIESREQLIWNIRYGDLNPVVAVRKYRAFVDSDGAPTDMASALTSVTEL